MKRERLNDELTIVGLVLILLFVLFYFINLTYKFNKVYLESLEAKKIAVELYEKQNTYIEMLDSMNKYADELEEELREYEYLKKLKKDLARNPWR